MPNCTHYFTYRLVSITTDEFLLCRECSLCGDEENLLWRGAIVMSSFDWTESKEGQLFFAKKWDELSK